MITTKRAYDTPSARDGARILVDRLWPRGVSRDEAEIDEWLKEIAPSDGLRKWFGHDPSLWDEFRSRYRQELQTHASLLERLKEKGKRETVTLVYAAKDEEHNNAVVLKEILEEQ